MKGHGQVAETLTRSSAGDEGARERLLDLIYDDLRGLASAHLAREGGHHTLQPTALVHEAYARLVGDRATLQGRTHFMALAACMMRRVLVDHARAKKAQKRGRGKASEDLDEERAIQWEDPTEVLALHEALESLARSQPRQARVVELRFFAGLSLEETGEVLGVGRDTVKLDWRFARAWLNRRLRDDRGERESS